MKENVKEEFKERDLSKVSKISIFKSKESEEVIECVILNPEEIIQEEYIIQRDTKGKELIKGTLIKGKLELMLSKENYNKLVTRNEINKLEFLEEGHNIKDYVDMYELIQINGSNYKVLI